MDLEALRMLDRLLAGNNYPDATLEKLLPHVQQYLDGVPSLRSLPLAGVSNGLVSVAGGRK